MELDYKKMLAEIDNLVENDFCFDMECKQIPDSEQEYSQSDAKRMSDIIGKVYSIAHCIHCSACQSKYLHE